VAQAQAAVRLRGGSGGLRLVVEPDVAEADLGPAVTEALGRTGRLGAAEIAVELPGRLLTPALAETVCRAVSAAGAGLTVRTLTTQVQRDRRPPRPAPGPSAVLHRTNLRAGQEVSAPGDVVVLGHVHRGARVTAGGDVVVLGRLEGTAHAGALGDTRRIVYATRFAPLQVRIGELIAVNPGEPDGAEPEWAHVEEGRIVVEVWRAPSLPQADAASGAPVAVS
jgi:septum site-determining protein MinC